MAVIKGVELPLLMSSDKIFVIINHCFLHWEKSKLRVISTTIVFRDLNFEFVDKVFNV